MNLPALLRVLGPVALGLLLLPGAAAAQTPPRLVADLAPGARGSAPSWSTSLGDDLVFVASDGRTADSDQLFRTDGTAAGTVQLTVIDGQTSSADTHTAYPFPAGAKICFSALGGLWVTDGTRAGTYLLRPGVVPSIATDRETDLRIPLNGATYFMGHDAARTGLWKTDGSAMGTAFVTAATGKVLGELGARVLFADGSRLRSTDGGSAADITVVQSGGKQGTSLAPVGHLGNKLLFTGMFGTAFELWVTDGTAPGTAKVAALPFTTGSSTPPVTPHGDAYEFGGRTYFATTDDGATLKLYATDGTEAGTVAIGTRPIQYRAFGQFSELGTKLLLANSTPATGPELFSITGTAAPALVADTVAGANGVNPMVLVPWKDKLLFTGGTTQLYATDGASVAPVGPSYGSIKILDVTSKAVFLAVNDGAAGEELWAITNTLPPTDGGVPDGSVDPDAGPKGDAGTEDASAPGPDGAAADGGGSPGSPASGGGDSGGCSSAGPLAGGALPAGATLGASVLAALLAVVRRRSRRRGAVALASPDTRG